ncbi:MAG: two-component sensor histidine kinase [Gammaproteobacteria bacterium]|nr:MAG: two-component sensor histidine kinase [Gammaproteobacteria bacterium]
MKQFYDKKTPADSSQSDTSWRSLLYFNLYRIFIYTLFLVLAAKAWIGTGWQLLLVRNGALLLGVSAVSFALALIAAAAIWKRRPSLDIQAHTYIFADILSITLIMNALGGVGSGAGVLMVASLGAGALLLPGRTALVFAAIASLAVLGQRLHSELNDLVSDGSYTQAGMLGVAYFAITLLSLLFARRAKETAELADQRGVDLANIAQLNELIIRRIPSGVVVVDPEGQIVTLNESAWYLMGMPSAGEPALGDLAPTLREALDDWQVTGRPNQAPIRLGDDVPAVIPHFAALGRSRDDGGTLITLEDTSTVEQRAQQMNLASLGRLTASIAHEIRNPLSAIIHAGELLDESPNLKEADHRLTEIIKAHSGRVNEVIENVLQLSRRGNAEPEELELADWITHFAEDFRRDQELNLTQLRTELPTQNEIRVFADRAQLHQVVWNLCSNAIRYGLQNSADARLIIRTGYSTESRRPFIEVIDNGPGIEPGQAEKIFEPFYTSDSAGAGLGLYIARQLAESNQARLRYRPEPGGGSCFRISFYTPKMAQASES